MLHLESFIKRWLSGHTDYKYTPKHHRSTLAVEKVCMVGWDVEIGSEVLMRMESESGAEHTALNEIVASLKASIN